MLNCIANSSNANISSCLRRGQSCQQMINLQEIQNWRVAPSLNTKLVGASESLPPSLPPLYNLSQSDDWNSWLSSRLTAALFCFHDFLSNFVFCFLSRVSKELGGSKRCEDVNQLSRFLLSFWVGWEQEDELSNNGRIKHSLSAWLCLLWESHIKTFQNVSHHDEYYRAAPAPVIITLQFSGPQRCFKYYESDDRGQSTAKIQTAPKSSFHRVII